jgi:hypothetical protein
MGFWNIIPILGNHVEDQLRPEADAPPEPSEKDAYAHELVHEPQPYFPADEADSGKKQS